MSETLLEVKHLKKYFNTKAGLLHAVDDVSFSIAKGETLGLVGESGCGKSTIGRAILRLHEPTSGEVLLDGTDVTKLNKQELRELRRKMQIVFQDPYSSLDGRKSVFESIGEPLIIQKICKTKEEYEKRVYTLMETVGLAERLVNAYPHELDGGRRQRVGIARALALNPSFLVLDEPVSALDVSIQAQVLNLMQKLQKDMGLTLPALSSMPQSVGSGFGKAISVRIRSLNINGPARIKSLPFGVKEPKSNRKPAPHKGAPVSRYLDIK